MSIINEALKKAEQEKNKMLTDEPGYTNIASKIYKPKPEASKEEIIKPLLLEPLPPVVKKHNYMLWVLMAILISIGLMSISILVTKPKSTVVSLSDKMPEPSSLSQVPLSPPSPEVTETTPSTTVPEVPIEPVAVEPVKIPLSPPSLILSGIVLSQGESFAIIDGTIVKKGDVVSGAKVKEIYSDKVILEFDGAEFSIRSP